MLILNFTEKVIYYFLPFLQKWQKFIRYSIVGATATIGDFSVYFSLTRGFDWFNHYYIAANICSFTIGSIIGYFLNKFWTFEQGKQFITAQYAKFLTSNIITLIVLQFCFYFFVSVLGIYDIVAKFLLLAISIGINFSFSYFWTFKRVSL